MTAEKQSAFEFIEPKLPSMRTRVLEVVKKARRGLTAKEISLALGLKPQTVTGRLDDLQDAGLVYGVVSHGGDETRYFVEEDEKRQAKLIAHRREFKFWSDLKKWQNRYPDILSKDTFARIQAEADRNFRTRKVHKL